MCIWKSTQEGKKVRHILNGHNSLIQKGNFRRSEPRPCGWSLRCLAALFCLEWACRLYLSSLEEPSSAKPGGIKLHFWIYFLGRTSFKPVKKNGYHRVRNDGELHGLSISGLGKTMRSSELPIVFPESDNVKPLYSHRFGESEYLLYVALLYFALKSTLQHTCRSL